MRAYKPACKSIGMLTWRTIKPPDPDSLIDIQEIEFDFEMTEGSERQLTNPLGTSFDMADIFIAGSVDWLDCSPFLFVWDENLENIYKRDKGIWLGCGDDKLILKFGPGEPPQPPLTIGRHCFYPVPKNFHDTRQTLRLSLTCMN